MGPDHEHRGDVCPSPTWGKGARLPSCPLQSHRDGIGTMDAILVVGGNDFGPRSWVEQVLPRIDAVTFLAAKAARPCSPAATPRYWVFPWPFSASSPKAEIQLTSYVTVH